MKSYLTSREKDVVDIMMWLYNQEYATDAYIKEQREEAKAERAKEIVKRLSSTSFNLK